MRDNRQFNNRALQPVNAKQSGRAQYREPSVV